MWRRSDSDELDDRHRGDQHLDLDDRRAHYVDEHVDAAVRDHVYDD